MSRIKRIAILGAGESGLGAAQLARKHGVEVFLSELKNIPEDLRIKLVKLNVEIEERFHTHSKLTEGVDYVVKSPGIPSGIPILKSIESAGVPIISEIEWASKFCDKPTVAITGSNGKTTTTLLTTHLLNAGGKNAFACGNIGNSFSAAVAQDKADVFVVEVSSFQLDDIQTFKPSVSAILNITPDHLDRYRSFAHYADSKRSISQFQDITDTLFIDKRNPELSSVKTGAKVKSILPQNRNSIQLSSGLVVKSSETTLIGEHNMLNAAFACEITQLFDVSDSDIRIGLSNFQNAPHRLEFIRTLNGVDFVNDSKATNLDAVKYALEGIEKPIIWIAGGVDKGNEYEQIQDIVSQKVKALIILSEETSKLENAFNDVIPQIIDARSAQEAVTLAVRYASNGDVVLLSPACASFDLFKNYKDRGDQFRDVVNALKG